MDIKKTAISGAIWKFIERILAQGISLTVSIILARLLEPSDYGLVSIVTIFFAFANVLISGGLNTALMQRKYVDEEEYSTVFTLSLFISIVLYILLYLFSPLISDLYNQPELIYIIRVMGLSLPIYATKSIVSAYTSATLQFKKFFFSTLGGTIFSAFIGICMAFKGFGAWALVAQQLSNTLIDTIILYCVTNLKVRIYISIRKFKELFSYGWKIFASSILNTIYNQLNPLIIGIKFTSADLSFYTKGQQFPEALSTSLINTFSSVLFPILSKFQDDKEKLLRGTRQFIRLVSFVVFPIMIGFFSISETFVRILLTDKWLPVVYYIRIFCFQGLFDIVTIGNCETIKAIGRSDIFLKIEILKKTLYFLTLVVFITFSQTPEILALSVILITIIATVINCIPNIWLIGYKIKYQIQDLFINFLCAFVMGGIVLLVGKLNLNIYMLFLLQVVVGIFSYIIICLICKNENFYYVKNIIINYLNKRRKEV